MNRPLNRALPMAGLALALACQGDTTTPNLEPVTVVVSPVQVTVASGQSVAFVATGLTRSGKQVEVDVSWTSTAGAISSNGVLTTALESGTGLVVATAQTGAADTSTVTVTPAPSPVALALIPTLATTSPGGSLTFFAYGRTAAGDSIAVPVTYSSTGGSITGTGVYTAGSASGTYRVIARSAAGLADTSLLVISSVTVTSVTLLPEVAASRPGETTRFTASVRGSSGTELLEPVAYGATCGTVTGTGIFTAPLNGSSSCLVIASAGGKADTTTLVVLSHTPTQGLPYGPHGLWTSPTTIERSGVAPFTASIGHVPAADLVAHISSARSRGVRLVLTMTGGSHELYKTAGVFDVSKWRQAMDRFDTPAIREAVAAGVTDGTIIGNSVMDEPFQSDGMHSDPHKSWGPKGTLTRERVDGLCAYVRNIFPTLAVGVFHNPAAFEPDHPYGVCQFLVVQYATRRGDITRWRDAALALTSRDGMSVIFSMNLLDGGTQDKDGVYDCAGTGGLGTYRPNCRMTPEQIRSYGTVIGPAGCALLSWKYDSDFMSRPQNQAAFSELAILLSRHARIPCTGTRVPG